MLYYKNDDPIECFSIMVDGMGKESLSRLLEKVSNKNRWSGRFYFGIFQLGYKISVTVSKERPKDEIQKSDFIKKLLALAPPVSRWGKRITIM
jgi:hypothetical protein